MSRLKTVTDSVKDKPVEIGNVFHFLRAIPCANYSDNYLAQKSGIFYSTAAYRYKVACLIKDPSCLG